MGSPGKFFCVLKLCVNLAEAGLNGRLDGLRLHDREASPAWLRSSEICPALDRILGCSGIKLGGSCIRRRLLISLSKYSRLNCAAFINVSNSVKISRACT